MSDRINIENRYDSRLNSSFDWRTTVVFDPENSVVTIEERWGNGTPSREYHHIELQIAAAKGATFANVDGLAEMLGSAEAQELLHEIAAGHEVYWDGSNHRGRLSEDAAVALERIESLIQPVFDLLPGLWTAADWFQNGDFPVTADTTDAELAELAGAEVAGALPEHHLDLADVLQFLTEKRDELARDLVDLAGGDQ